VVRTSATQAVQAKLNLESQKIAGMRAKDALCGLIIGDKASWEGSVIDSMKDQIQEFESLDKDDPLARKDPANVSKFEKARQSFVSRLESNDVYKSARQGILPPGVNTKTWFDSDHAWAYGISVYVPSLTNAAANTAREMLDSTILQPVDNGGGKQVDKQSSGFTDEKDMNVTRPGKEVKPGPTGKIEPEENP